MNQLRRIPHPLYCGLLVAGISFAINLLWVFNIPPLQTPDEPAHLQTVMAVRSGDLLPAIHWQDGQIKGQPGSPAVQQYARTHGIEQPFKLLPYEFSQPPLYYWAAGAAALLVPPDPALVLYVARIVAALFGAGAIYFCWAATRQLAPTHPQWAVATAALVALLPQVCFNAAGAGNDSSVLCFGMAAFYSWFRALRDPMFDRWGGRMGVITGLAILSKLSGAVLLPGLALVIVFRAVGRLGQAADGRQRVLYGVQQAVGAGLGLLLVCGLWVLRNLWVYGEPSGTTAIFQYYQGKFALVQFTSPLVVQMFVQTTWRTFSGWFGWMNVPMPQPFYLQVGYIAVVLTALSALAMLVRAPLSTLLRQAILIMSLVGLTLLASYVQFTTAVAAQLQGRYLFLALLPLALLATAGLYTLTPRGRLRHLALSAPLIWLALMNTTGLALVRYAYNGGDDPHLPPGTAVTRGEAVTALVQRFAVHGQQPVRNATFSDVPPNSPWFAVAEIVAQTGISRGVSCGRENEPCDAAGRPALRPDNPVPREQFAELLMRSAGWPPVQAPAGVTFADVPATAEFYSAIETATCRKVLQGYPCGAPGEPCDDRRRPYFRPTFNLRRADLSVAVLPRQTQPCPTP